MTQSFDVSNNPHRRRNALNGDWVLVSPHRGRRPWLGQTEHPPVVEAVSYDESCYLCPGNERMGGDINPDYDATYTFTNDFAALKNDTTEAVLDNELFTMQAESGLCRVVCFSPDHSSTLAEMPVSQIHRVIACWVEQSKEIGALHPWVQIFENKGAMMGCSMPHPHAQIWAQDHPPTLVEREVDQQTRYYQRHQRPLLLDYTQQEIVQAERVVVENDHWLVVVPYWASWPFETLLLPKFTVSRLTEITPLQQQTLAEILAKITSRYDNLFECSFPYSMGWHSAPFDNLPHPEWQLHAHFYPPLLRSSGVRKFMVGYEMLAEAQRDMTPEQAATILRALSDIHYKNQLESNS